MLNYKWNETLLKSKTFYYTTDNFFIQEKLDHNTTDIGLSQMQLHRIE
jgi:hypothetical protein